MMQFTNPILKGFNPDSSFCRVGQDYYMVTSSFEFFPGVPIYHSRNLADWELIGYCLSDGEQLPLQGARASGGIYAPTIRYHEGLFYMTTTNVTFKGNFIVYTDDIMGKWSPPVWINQGGIDPSLLFADETCYFCSNGHDENGGYIQLSQIDPRSGNFIQKPVIISRGTGCKHPEAPHLYKIDGQYYLMIAEGGTEYGHMESIFLSDSPYGFYRPCPRNPILSHKDYAGSPIQCTGHADLLEDHNGHYWLCCLGVRPIRDGLLHNLGRESFLAPVQWGEDGFPAVGDNGRIALYMDGPLPKPVTGTSDDFADDFTGEALSLHYNYYRNPERERYMLDSQQSALVLKGGPSGLSDEIESPTFLGIRQKEFEMSAITVVSLESKENAKAGITAFYNWSYHYEAYITFERGKCYVCLGKRVHDIEVVTAKHEIEPRQQVKLKLVASQERYTFYYLENSQYIELGFGLTAGLCTEQTAMMTFTGTYLGMFAQGGEAHFTNFEVKCIKKDSSSQIFIDGA